MGGADRNIFLIGPMGVGKTSVGRELARYLSMDFFDSDLEVEKATEKSIPLLFELYGEQGFRRYEREIITKLVQKKHIVLATGGGAVLDADNRQRLSCNGFIVYLKADLDKLVAQTRSDKKRPLLQSADLRQVISMLLQQREQLYQEIADLILDTSALSIYDAVNNICKHLLINEEDNS